ncbi:hypothetical protein BH09PAT1_BH09PAT1_1850 [soil metagenome]
MTEIAQPRDQKMTSFSRFRSLVGGLRNNGVKDQNPAPYSSQLAPSDVRYAFEYRNGELDIHNVESLVNNNFPDLANYLIMKRMDNDPLAQRDYLERYVNVRMEDEGNATQGMHNLQLDAVSTIKGQDMKAVPAKKLAKVFVQGTDLWQKRFEDIATELKTDPRNPTPVYLAYAGILGLGEGIDTFKGGDKELMVLIPDWLENSATQNAGYTINLGPKADQRVKLFGKDFERPEEFAFIDDTLSTGEHLRKVWDFWDKGEGHAIPTDNLKVVYQT